MVSYNLKKKARRLGADDLTVSWRKNKKYAVLYDGRWIHFGDNRYEDYTTHRDSHRRRSYRRRSSRIRSRSGKYTYRDPNYANFWAYNLLW
jgi:hypothetical protein